VMAYNFDGFWEDIGGSIEDYYNFHMKLVQADAPFSFITANSPFFASPQVTFCCQSTPLPRCK
jgi:ADP-glucose pyrophosphorylase